MSWDVRPWLVEDMIDFFSQPGMLEEFEKWREEYHANGGQNGSIEMAILPNYTISTSQIREEEYDGPSAC